MLLNAIEPHHSKATSLTQLPYPPKNKKRKPFPTQGPTVGSIALFTPPARCTADDRRKRSVTAPTTPPRTTALQKSRQFQSTPSERQQGCNEPVSRKCQAPACFRYAYLRERHEYYQLWVVLFALQARQRISPLVPLFQALQSAAGSALVQAPDAVTGTGQDRTGQSRAARKCEK